MARIRHENALKGHVRGREAKARDVRCEAHLFGGSHYHCLAGAEGMLGERAPQSACFVLLLLWKMNVTDVKVNRRGLDRRVALVPVSRGRNIDKLAANDECRVELIVFQ